MQCEIFFRLQNLKNEKMHRFGKVLTLKIPKISLILNYYLFTECATAFMMHWTG